MARFSSKEGAARGYDCSNLHISCSHLTLRDNINMRGNLKLHIFETGIKLRVPTDIIVISTRRKFIDAAGRCDGALYVDYHIAGAGGGATITLSTNKYAL